MRLFAAITLTLATLLLPADPAAAAPVPISPVAGFRLLSYPTGQGPYNLTNYFWLPGGGLITAGANGRITYVAPGAKPTKLARVPDVRTISDHAMLGFAAANDYATSGTVYLSYEKGEELGIGYGMVEEWTAAPPSAPTSFTYNRTIMDGSAASPQLIEEGLTHGLDSVVVAPDDTLFVSIGDNSTNHRDPATLRAQDLDQPYGKLLHITTDGAGVPSNPFYAANTPSSWRSRVYAYGFRNPFRFALDPRNGLIHLGDVGWKHREEVDTVRSGDNAGWPCYEGTLQTAFISGDPVCQALYASGSTRMPIATYPHAGQDAAVVGGMFYTGDSYPAPYRNAFFFADYVRGTLSTLRTNRDGELSRAPERVPVRTGVIAPVAFQPGPGGDVTFADLSAGLVYRLMTAITAKFASLAHPWGVLGRPVGAEHDVGDGRVREYLRGRIYWRPTAHAHEVHGPILATYLARRGVHGCLGFPVSDVVQLPGGARSRFQHGTITYRRATARATVSCQP